MGMPTSPGNASFKLAHFCVALQNMIVTVHASTAPTLFLARLELHPI